MPSKTEILSFLSENKPLFQDQFYITKLGLFGSYARETADENSDIDILIELKPNTPNIYELKKELREILKNRFRKEVDICRERAIKPAFRNLIFNEVVYV